MKAKYQKLSFSRSTNIQINIWEQFLQLKACKSVEIYPIGIEEAQLELNIQNSQAVQQKAILLIKVIEMQLVIFILVELENNNFL